MENQETTSNSFNIITGQSDQMFTLGYLGGEAREFYAHPLRQKQVTFWLRLLNAELRNAVKTRSIALSTTLLVYVKEILEARVVDMKPVEVEWLEEVFENPTDPLGKITELLTRLAAGWIQKFTNDPGSADPKVVEIRLLFTELIGILNELNSLTGESSTSESVPPSESP